MVSEQKINELVVRAVQRAFDDWAAEHPALADVIDRITLTQRAVESIRRSDAYDQAMAGFSRESLELQMLNRLVDVATPLVRSLLSL
jgi:hypothetical protein